jgi:hypothetical protein
MSRESKIESSSIEEEQQDVLAPNVENDTTTILESTRTIRNGIIPDDIVTALTAWNLTWAQHEAAWLHEELRATWHRFEYMIEPYLNELHNASDAALQPFLPLLENRYVKIIRPYLIPEMNDKEMRELTVIASVTLLLSLVTLLLFRNPRYHRRGGRRQKHKGGRGVHSSNNSNHSNNHHRNKPPQPLPVRPSLHRGTDDSQMSKDGSFRNRLSSFDLSFRSRRRLTSLDPFWGADHALFVDQEDTTPQNELESAFLYDDEFDLSSITYYGPFESKLRYSAWTPPPTWAEASRRVIPQDATRGNLQRQIIVDVGKAACLKVAEGVNVTATSTSISLPISEWSVHVRTPVEGGILELYVKNTPKEDWLELTFTSAHSCAQFQLDLLAYQVFGRTLTSLYRALEIVHQGSAAHPGKEFVLHDMEHGDDTITTTAGGVAWDDVMRSLNSLPSIRLSLERLLVAQRQELVGRPRINSEASVTPSAATTPKAADDGGAASATPDTPAEAKVALSLTEDYLEKRLLLGPVDFFRLFIPPLPQWALPQRSNSETRVQHLLRWRKRLARASSLVQTYVRARTLVNQGWNLLNKVLPDPYLMRRLAYDDITENQQRDLVSTNEYYEATVSRDVRCGIRSVDKSKLLANGSTNKTNTATTEPRHVLYQAYTLVGCHVFRLPKPDRWHKHSLRPNRDPVEALPSLRSLISSHPEEEFMVNSFFCEGIRIAMVQVYVRSLPKGVDQKFDAAVS